MYRVITDDQACLTIFEVERAVGIGIVCLKGGRRTCVVWVGVNLAKLMIFKWRIQLPDSTIESAESLLFLASIQSMTIFEQVYNQKRPLTWPSRFRRSLDERIFSLPLYVARGSYACPIPFYSLVHTLKSPEGDALLRMTSYYGLYTRILGVKMVPRLDGRDIIGEIELEAYEKRFNILWGKHTSPQTP